MMDSLVEILAEATAERVGRRGLLSRALRGLVGVGVGAAGLFGSQRFAFATTCCDWAVPNSCGAGYGYCAANAAHNGCNIYRNFCSAKYCQTGTSNCSGGYVSYGYWDCCCDNNLYRCRDCGPAGQGTVCICSIQLQGSCVC